MSYAKPKCPPGSKCGLGFCQKEWKKWRTAKAAYKTLGTDNRKKLAVVYDLLKKVSNACLDLKGQAEKYHSMAWIALYIGRTWARLPGKCYAGAKIRDCITNKRIDQISALAWYAQAHLMGQAMKQLQKHRPINRQIAGKKLLSQIVVSTKNIKLMLKCRKLKNCAGRNDGQCIALRHHCDMKLTF